MKKIYIAGPDVFEQNSIEIGKKLVSLCEKYGYIGLYPLDNVVDFSQPKHKIATDIFKANVKMIQESDIIVANLNAFRGKEPDSGTVWECGYGYGIGKEVYGYMQETKEYIESFSAEEKREENGMFWDNENRFIEDFSNPVNLMIAHSAKVIQGDFETVLKTLNGE
ncbi:nucleoside 2-deoxyribosyltransferase [Sulfurimonas sp.]|uniref:nucleoside 2-deoxyribosyltransferase n=1 Tax=Sulfurimonas sp. TaxID=2022749 RepID=UPI00260865BF|nr:nucleoside 2-deoxyribosyltransferase [Sulfurimonas sp.]